MFLHNISILQCHIESKSLLFNADYLGRVLKVVYVHNTIIMKTGFSPTLIFFLHFGLNWRLLTKHKKLPSSHNHLALFEVEFSKLLICRHLECAGRSS